MITCPSCNHQNPEGSLQCENCYTPLPASTSCPNCGASVQTDATFCGQCGFNLQAENPLSASVEETAINSLPNIPAEEVSLPDERIPLAEANPDILPQTPMLSSIQSPWDDNEWDDAQIEATEDDRTFAQTQELTYGFPETESSQTISFMSETPEAEFAEAESSSANEVTMSWETDAPDLDLGREPTAVSSEELARESEQFPTTSEFDLAPPTQAQSTSETNSAAMGNLTGATQLQIQTASLLHLQSNTTIEIAQNLDVVHIGKPNGQIPPDIDVAGFPDSEVVSRVHADIRIEGDAYYIEDVGSSNGTYINHAPLLKGNRHRLRAGDRVAFGKGDLVTFIFQLS
ncbi:MAG: FHA domain-containing protein [Pleurocapsa sp.]